jgi:dUTP pyrophosphatase
MILEYSKVRHNSRTPERANPSDAGLDIFFCPDEANAAGIWLSPGGSGLFSTGLKFGIPHGYMLEVKNRSGNASKRHLLVGACVIDSGYEGEVFVNLHNVGRDPQFIEPGMKIAQVVMTPVVHFRPQEVEESKIYSYPITISDRGIGSLGSTDGQ